jgi:hypothetical protein
MAIYPYRDPPYELDNRLSTIITFLLCTFVFLGLVWIFERAKADIEEKMREGEKRQEEALKRRKRHGGGYEDWNNGWGF